MCCCIQLEKIGFLPEGGGEARRRSPPSSSPPPPLAWRNLGQGMTLGAICVTAQGVCSRANAAQARRRAASRRRGARRRRMAVAQAHNDLPKAKIVGLSGVGAAVPVRRPAGTAPLDMLPAAQRIASDGGPAVPRRVLAIGSIASGGPWPCSILTTSSLGILPENRRTCEQCSICFSIGQGFGMICACCFFFFFFAVAVAVASSSLRFMPPISSQSTEVQ